MSISSRQYAEITEFILDNSQDQQSAEKSIQKLAKLIVENHDQSKLEQIIEDFNDLLRKKKGVIEVRTTSARELSEQQKGLLKQAIAERLGVEENLVSLTEEIDKNLLGGISIQIGDELIDGSLKTKFERLENSLS